MKKHIKAYIFILSNWVLLLPSTIFAQPVDGGTPPPPLSSGGGSEGLINPIKVDSIQELLVILLNLVVIIATPIVVLFIIFAGFKYVTARGNPSQIQEATQALTYAIIGGILIIGAVAITRIIEDLVSSFA